MPDTNPVQGPESEIIGNLVTSHLMALRDARNQQIVALLNSGVTSKTEIADILGYANHSAVSFVMAADHEMGRCRGPCHSGQDRHGARALT